MAVEIGPDALRASTRTTDETLGPGGTSGERQRLADVGKAEAQAMWDDTKASMRSVLNEKQSSTADDLGDFAGALRNAARSINPNGPVARIASHTADSLERLSGNLRNKDFDGVLHDVQAFARNQPAVFLGMTVAAGFLAARFLKSGAPHPEAGPEREASRFSTATEHTAGTEPQSAASAATESPFPQDPRRS
jgi:hypothetical protein